LYKIQEGRILLKNNDFELARKIFEEAFELSRDLNVSYYFIGNTFAAESNVIYDKAIELEKNLNGSLEKNDQSQKLKIDAEGMLGKAIPMWGYYIENMPEYSWMILPTLKDALQALNRYDDIEKLLITANKKNKKNVDILSHLADYYANKGDVDKALSTINNALDINKNSLIAQLKKLKINSLKNKENSLSNELDKLIFSLLRDKRYIKYKQSYNDENMKWLFETNDIT
jgi:tetratricopeptide (TPR) repeat protein